MFITTVICQILLKYKRFEKLLLFIVGIRFSNIFSQLLGEKKKERLKDPAYSSHNDVMVIPDFFTGNYIYDLFGGKTDTYPEK